MEKKREQDFADLQKWGVNLIRWQIKAPRDLSPAEWIRETRKRAAILPEVLAAGEKYGSSDGEISCGTGKIHGDFYR